MSLRTGNPLNRPHGPGCRKAWPIRIVPGFFSLMANRPFLSVLVGISPKSSRSYPPGPARISFSA